MAKKKVTKKPVPMGKAKPLDPDALQKEIDRYINHLTYLRSLAEELKEFREKGSNTVMSTGGPSWDDAKDKIDSVIECIARSKKKLRKLNG